MKLVIKNLNKSFGDNLLIKDFSYSFENKGFYVICGPSGCGKSTLLNVLSTLVSFDSGEIKYDDFYINEKKENDLRDFRLRNFGYVFQSYSLFEEDTVINNVMLLCDSYSSLSKDLKTRKANEVLKIVGMEKHKNKFVKNLSGGEKQRVALARALVNNPKVIFADEPTGSLDSLNGKKVFEILKKISEKCLVICVTHDKELAERYCDIILNFYNKSIYEEKAKSIEYKNTFLNMIERKNNKKNVISDGFIFKHFMNNIKNHKIRFSIILSILTISFFSIGLAFSLKESISNSLESAFTSVMNNNALILERKNEDFGLVDYVCASENEIKKIYDDYKSDIEYLGTNYIVNFENFFKDNNKLINKTKSISQNIEGFNARSFNEFIYIDEEQSELFYPIIEKKLNVDEIALEITFPTLKSICKYLYIEKTEESLKEYIKNNDLIVDLVLSNEDWGYNDDFLFNVVSFKVGYNNRVYHNDPLFNKLLFEDNLQFPSSENLNKTEDYPWVMKKINYIKTNDFQTSFLDKISLDEKYKNYLFDSNSHYYSPKEYAENSINYTNKIFVYSVFKKDVPTYLVNKFSKISKNLNNYYFSTSGGYLNLGTQMFSGFSNQTYFSKSIEEIDEIINTISGIDPEKISMVELPEKTLSSNAINISDLNVRFTSKPNNLISGKNAELVNEITVSKSMASKLEISTGNLLNVMQVVDKKKIGNRYEYSFKKAQLKVVGITNDEKLLISGYKNFSVSFFRDVMQISSFQLLPSSIIYEFDDKVSDSDIEKLNSYYDDYCFVNPLDDIDLGISDTLNYLQYVLLGLAIMAALSSTFLLIIINYIQVAEMKKDYSILVVLGFQNSEISKLSLNNLIIPILIGLISASCLLFGAAFLINSSISNSLGIAITFSISLKPFIFMIIEALIILVFTLEFSKIPLKKLNYIKNIH